jgi:SET domain-containing protein
MRALRDIKIGEEINFDYTKNESNISTSFQCKCGAEKCIGLIGSSNSTPTHL